MVTAEAVKRTEKKPRENALSSQVDGNFFIYPFLSDMRKVTLTSFQCVAKVNFLFFFLTRKVNFLLVTRIIHVLIRILRCSYSVALLDFCAAI